MSAEEAKMICNSCGMVLYERDVRSDFGNNLEAYILVSKLICPICKGPVYQNFYQSSS